MIHRCHRVRFFLPTLPRIGSIALGFLSLGMVFHASAALTVTFVRIAQTGDDPPGLTGPLTDFDAFCSGSPLQSLAPSVDVNGRVTFTGVDTVSPPCLSPAAGVFLGTGDGTLTTVVDRSTDPPGTVGSFANFEAPAVGPYGVAFYGRDASFVSGIFTDPTGPISLKT